MSSLIEPRVLVSICETNLNDQFKPSFRDNRDRNSQQETSSLLTCWNKTKKKQNRDASRVVCKTFREDMSYPASARNIPTNNIRLPRASWQDDDINITCHQTHMPIKPRQELILIEDKLPRNLIVRNSHWIWNGGNAQESFGTKTEILIVTILSMDIPSRHLLCRLVLVLAVDAIPCVFDV